MGYVVSVFVNFFVCLIFGVWCNFLFELVFEGILVGDFVGCMNVFNKDGGIIVVGIGKVVEVKGWFDGGIGGGEVNFFM